MDELKRNLLLIKGLLFQVNCFKCKKLLERLSINKKILDNKLICNSCFEATKVENKKIIFEIIDKYLSNKNGNFRQSIRVLYNSVSNIGLEPYSLDEAKNFLSTNLSNLKIKKSTKDIDEIIHNKNLYETSLEFLGDLEKLQKLLRNKSIEIDYFTILAMFIEFIDLEYSKMLEDSAAKMHNIIIESFGKNISKEALIMFCIKSGWKFDYDFKFETLYKIMEKLNLSYTKEEIADLIEKIRERMELEEFEQGLGSQKKICIGDFRGLNGHEFEEYIQKLFELFGYTVVRTPLTGDQGADLIVSKDGLKTVVQAKKYEASVSNKAVQEVVAAKSYYNAEKAIVVTNSTFTSGAIDLALANGVELWDSEKLENIVKNLEPQKEQTYEGSIECSSKEDKKNIIVTCTLCKKEFEYEINLKELKDSKINETINFKIQCPYCGIAITLKTQKTEILTVWNCQYCSKKFNTKEEAEAHERECNLRDQSK